MECCFLTELFYLLVIFTSLSGGQDPTITLPQNPLFQHSKCDLPRHSILPSRLLQRMDASPSGEAGGAKLTKLVSHSWMKPDYNEVLLGGQ